jgi:MtrB/PioB family decaheme-associated outer membrane protein
VRRLLSATYKLNATEDLHLNAGYSYSKRRTSNDQNAIAAFSGNQTLLAVPGLNGGDFIGFHPYFDGSRKEQMLKAGVDWMASDKLSLGLNGRYTDDDYSTTYGVQGGKTWSVNLDATFSYSEKGSVSAYLAKEYRDRDLTSLYKVTTTGSGLRTATPAPWGNSLTDEDITFGLGAKQGGLMGGKLALAADLTYSLGETSYGTSVPTGPVTTGGLTCSAPSLLQCGNLPDIKNRMTQVKLSGDYSVSKSGKVVVGYLYQHLKSDDYYYNGLQYLYTPTSLLPTNQQSGSYSVNVISATYVYAF